MTQICAKELDYQCEEEVEDGTTGSLEIKKYFVQSGSAGTSAIPR